MGVAGLGILLSFTVGKSDHSNVPESPSEQAVGALTQPPIRPSGPRVSASAGSPAEVPGGSASPPTPFARPGPVDAVFVPPADSSGHRWVRLVPAPPGVPSPVRRATPEADAADVADRVPAPRRSAEGDSRAVTGQTRRSPDPCATFKDVRRHYCYEILDNLTG